ncbi:MAG: YitT family protein [Bacteroides sp.]|nr:YitT family protein [Bacteroides sp.]MDE5810487.1 YitT family protein [Muribaculaceae bacterium]
MQLTKTRLYCEAKDYFFIVLGIFMYGFGFSAFIAPEGVVIGGMAGFGQDIYYLTLRLFGWGIPVAITMYVTNATLLVLAFRVVGKQFVIRTIFGATMMSLAIGILQPLFPVALLHGQKFLSILVGSLFCGIGIGLAFIHNGSTAGVDIIAAMVAKKSNVSIGRTMQFVDFCTVSAILIINPNATIENVAFGFVNIFLVAYVCDEVINTNRQATQFMIFSPYWQEIATTINDEAHRGCTVLDGMGWYSKKEIKILLVMCRKIESVTIFRIVKSIDRNALITQSKVNGVYGKGFDEMKIKIKPKQTIADNNQATQEAR